AGLGMVLSQIVALDVVFSLDSVITAIGMTDYIEVMVAAVVVSVGIMIAMIRPISRFMKEHPAVKILALSFMLLIGVTLMAEGFGQHFEKGYIYAAFGFSLFVEILQLRSAGTGESRAAT
ncbi:MAG: TerC family protein, partial [Gemmatimonadota bacterium]